MNYATREPNPEHADKWDYAHSLGTHAGQQTFTVRIFKWTKRLNGTNTLSFKKSYGGTHWEFKIPTALSDTAFTRFNQLCDDLNAGQIQAVDRRNLMADIQGANDSLVPF